MRNQLVDLPELGDDLFRLVLLLDYFPFRRWSVDDRGWLRRRCAMHGSIVLACRFPVFTVLAGAFGTLRELGRVPDLDGFAA